jgi:uncharacterized protein (TIGR02145 family)
MSKEKLLSVAAALLFFSNSFGQLLASKRTVQYHDLKIAIDYSGNMSVLIIALDNRPMIVDKSQKSNFVGYVRAEAGVAWPLKTLSDNTFIEDFSGLFRDALKNRGFLAQNTIIEDEQELAEKLSTATNQKIDKIVYMKVNYWHTDQYDAALVGVHKRWLQYDVDITVADMNGNKMLQKKFEVPKIDLASKGNYKEFIPEAVKIEVKNILNDVALKNALLGGTTGDANVAMIAVSLTSSATDNQAADKTEATHDVDGNTVGTTSEVTIGTQTWMNKNLNADHFANGDPIFEAKINGEWERAGEERKPAWCYFNNDAKLGSEYGKLYNWYAVADARAICPAGWHVPSDDEWSVLVDFLGDDAGDQLKSEKLWKRRYGNDLVKFTAVPAGLRGPSGKYNHFGIVSYWWTSEESSKNYGRLRVLEGPESKLTRDSNGKELGFSVRCLRD